MTTWAQHLYRAVLLTFLAEEIVGVRIAKLKQGTPTMPADRGLNVADNSIWRTNRKRSNYGSNDRGLNSPCCPRSRSSWPNCPNKRFVHRRQKRGNLFPIFLRQFQGSGCFRFGPIALDDLVRHLVSLTNTPYLTGWRPKNHTSVGNRDIEIKWKGFEQSLFPGCLTQYATKEFFL